ncbi:MAG: hypothetical protein P1P90_01235 [Patescibacteria group bacterium]|nr:hypothetical protein [Patescibacteria group bacterium]
MIKSRILNGLENQIGVNWAYISFSLIAAVFLRALIFGEQYATPLEVFIWYPVLVVTGFLLVKMFAKRFFSNSVGFEFRVLPITAILAISLGFVLSLLPFWGRVTAGMPLSLSQLATYVLTLGIYPFQFGPDGFLRGIAWVMAIVPAIFLYKESKDLFKSIFLGVLSWAAMTFVFLMPSLILIITMLFNSLPFTSTGAVMVGEFTRLNLFSYWGDGQLLRWFTGFGGQATNALLLYTASWIFMLGSIVWSISNFDLIKQALNGFKVSWIFSAICIVLFGFLAGSSHQGWIGLDAAAWGVFVLVLLFSWLYVRVNTLTPVQTDESMLVFWLLGLMLLGWPVFLGGVLLAITVYCKDQIKSLNLMTSWEWVADALVPIVMVLLFALFMRRGAVLEPVAIQIVLMFGLFAFLAGFVGYAKKVKLTKIWLSAGWVVIAGLLWIVAGVFSPVAIMMLAGVFVWMFWQKILEYSWEPDVLVWGVALLVLLVVIWLPRVAHPELIPR